MRRTFHCKRCGDLVTAGKRGALPEFCNTCRPIAYKKRYAGRYYVPHPRKRAK